MSGHDLRDVQQALWRAVRYDPAPADTLAHFVGDARLDAAGRLAIYRSMYWYRQVDALAGVFALLREALGAERFTKLVCQYIRKYPSVRPELEHLGHALPDFVAEHAPQWASLARLEWTRNLALLAPDAMAVCKPEQARPETFAAARIGFAPSLHVIDVDQAALRAFDATQEPADKGAEEHSRDVQAVAVWRQGFGVRHLPLAAAEARALRRAQSGECVGDVLSVFSTDDAGVATAFNMMWRWFARQWIERIDE